MICPMLLKNKIKTKKSENKGENRVRESVFIVQREFVGDEKATEEKQDVHGQFPANIKQQHNR